MDWIQIYILSFAVLAFAVEDIKARDCVITSASPCAFLYELILGRIYSKEWIKLTFGLDTILLASQAQFLGPADSAPGLHPEVVLSMLKLFSKLVNWSCSNGMNLPDVLCSIFLYKSSPCFGSEDEHFSAWEKSSAMEDMAYGWQMRQLSRQGDASRVVGNIELTRHWANIIIHKPLPGTEHLNPCLLSL